MLRGAKVYPNKQKTIKFYNLAWWKVCSCNFTVAKSDFQQSRLMISSKFDMFKSNKREGQSFFETKKIYFLKTRWLSLTRLITQKVSLILNSLYIEHSRKYEIKSILSPKKQNTVFLKQKKIHYFKTRCCNPDSTRLD